MACRAQHPAPQNPKACWKHGDGSILPYAVPHGRSGSAVHAFHGLKTQLRPSHAARAGNAVRHAVLHRTINRRLWSVPIGPRAYLHIPSNTMCSLDPCSISVSVDIRPASLLAHESPISMQVPRPQYIWAECPVLIQASYRTTAGSDHTRVFS